MAYHIPAGTLCSIAKNDEARRWKAHTTTKDLSFASPHHDGGKALVFEKNGWLLLIQKAKVNRAPSTAQREGKTEPREKEEPTPGSGIRNASV